VKKIKQPFKILLIILVMTISSYAIDYKLYDLKLKNEDFLPSGDKINSKLALFTAKLSNYVYDSSLASVTEAEQFATDNGFVEFQTKFFQGETIFDISLDNIYMHTLRKHIYVNNQLKEVIVIVFKGTSIDKPQDILTDANIIYTKFEANQNVKVHAGFNSSLKLFVENEDNIVFGTGKLSPKYYDSNTIFLITGHSLGGAIATLYGAYLREQGVAKDNLLVYTFGAPVVGNYIFYNNYDWISYGDKSMRHYRVINNYDIVAHTDVNWRYLYDGKEFILDDLGNFVSRTNQCSIYKAIENTFPWYLDYSIPDSDSNLPACSGSDHSIVNYIQKLQQHISPDDYYETLDVDITFTEEELIMIDTIISTDPQFRKAISRNKFDISKLSDDDKKRLVIELRKIGVGFGNKDYGDYGTALSTKTNAIATIGNTKLTELLKDVEDAEQLQAIDWAKFTAGTFFNIASAVGDVLSAGAGSTVLKTSKYIVVSDKALSVLTIIKKIDNANLPEYLKLVKKTLDSKLFTILKLLIETGFTVNDYIRQEIRSDQALASTLSNTLGTTVSIMTDAAIDQIIGENKGKILSLFLKILNDGLSNILKGSVEYAILDTNFKEAIESLKNSLLEMIPYAGSFIAEHNLVNKLYNDRANSQEATQAYDKYIQTSKDIASQIQFIQDQSYLKKLDYIMNSLSDQLYKSKQLEKKKEILTNYKNTQSKKLYLHIPSSATIDGTIATIPKDSAVKIGFNKYFESKQELIDSLQWNRPIKLFTKNQTTNSTQTIDATYDTSTHTLNFTSPTDEPLQLEYITYPTDTDTYFDISVSLLDMEFVKIETSVDETPTDDSTDITTPTQIIDHDDYTRDATLQIVTDNKRGLIWQDDERAKTTQLTWQEAMDYCESLDHAGYSTGWRLPTITELESIADQSKYTSIKDIFANTYSFYYWSATTYVFDSDYAWIVSFNGGDSYDYSKSNSYYVRCVRGRQ
jgi:hypothetical protein